MNSRNFFSELKRRNVMRMAGLYLVGAWLLTQVASTVLPMFGAPDWLPRSIVILLAIGFLPALIFSWVFEVTPEGLKRDADVPPDQSIAPQTARRMDRMIIAVLVLALGYFAVDKFVLAPRRSGVPNDSPSGDNTKSIAVLPFVDLSQTKDQEYFCDGISEELLDSLAKIEGLRVVARTSSFAFKGKMVSAGEVAQKLGVQHLLEGSLRRDGNRIRITAQLVDARKGFEVWSQTFERELQGVFALQDEISRAIVDKLKVKLALAPAGTTQVDTVAHENYLRGLYFLNKSSEEDLRKALAFFNQALDKEPNFSRAWTGVARVWLWLADEYVKPLDAYPAAEAAANKALALNPNDAEARACLAEATWVLGWNLAGPVAECERALTMDPNSAQAHFLLSALKPLQGDCAAAIAHIDAAEKLDPLSAAVSNYKTGLMIRCNRLDEALAAAQRTLQLDADYIYGHSPLARVYEAQGKLDEALLIYQRSAEDSSRPTARLALVHAQLGRQTEAREILRELIEKRPSRYVRADVIALVYASLGEPEQSFAWLETAYQEHSSSLQSSLLFREELKPLHSDPRFAELLRRVGLDPEALLNRD